MPQCKRLPGDQSREDLLSEMIRVDHAGEYGAKRIYEGQKAVLKHDMCYPTLCHMAEQEERHLRYFEKEMVRRRIRPTLLQPVWHVGAYVLGRVTATMGKEAAMACTVAVEEVIDEHYRQQLAQLEECETDLKNHIEAFRQEELEHRDTGLDNNARQAVAYPVLYHAIRGITRAAIALSKKI